MSDPSDDGWRPLGKPSRGAQGSAAGKITLSPFTRLARAHAISAAADGMIAVALAGSIFFSIDPSSARWRVALYLVLTIAPFAIVTPLIGPAIDGSKGGRRGMIVLTAGARAVLAFLMARHIDSLLLFPEAFGILVMQKGYSIAKSAVVPKLVANDEELVEANSKLALLSAVSGMAGAAVGAFFILFGANVTATLAGVTFIVATIATFRIPAVTVADAPADVEEKAELRGGGILLAASAMGVLRGLVGFTTFLLAFEFRGGEDGVDWQGGTGQAPGASVGFLYDVDVVGTPNAPAWQFGLVLLGAGGGALLGARLAPQLRKSVTEERIIVGALMASVGFSTIAAWAGGAFGAFLVAFAVGTAAATAKLAFDSLVQRDAPRANHGRFFAKFEGRFQLSWAVGAFIPVVLPLGAQLGYAIVAAASGFALFTYMVGGRAPEAHAARPDVADPEAPTEVFGPGDAPTDAQVDDAAQPTTELNRGSAEPAEPEFVDYWESSAPFVSAGEGVEISDDPAADPIDTPDESDRDDGQLGFWRSS